MASSIFEFALEITIRLEAEESSETNVSDHALHLRMKQGSGSGDVFVRVDGLEF